MTDDMSLPVERLARVPPFDTLPEEAYPALERDLSELSFAPDEVIFAQGAELAGLYVIERGLVEIRSGRDAVSRRGPGEVMGERGLLRDGRAMLTARATEPTDLLLIPAPRFHDLLASVPEFARWFDRARPSAPGSDDGPYATGLTALQVADVMARNPVSCRRDSTVQDVAKEMRDRTISSVLVMEGARLEGIVTVHDLVNKVLAEGHSGALTVDRIMTANPVTIAPDAVGLDALLKMAELRINHLPVADRRGEIVGMIGRTDLFRQQAATASRMAAEIVAADGAEEMAQVMARLPELLSHLTAAGTKPAAICRRITDLTDAATSRLLQLGEGRLGPPPVPYLWAACGSQGRREQTGVSDQDNCMILDDAVRPEHDVYFADLAQFVSDGLNALGFVYCPGDMMATNPRWRQPVQVWRRYFETWIAEPDEEAQMLSSVMFDLRPIAGQMALFRQDGAGLQDRVLELAKKNSIFVRHMIANSLKHTPPLSLFRGIAPIRSGEHRNTIDLKHAGVVPIVDLGRIYALKGGFSAVNTRERIVAAGDAGVISASGARDLLDAYDLISIMRLKHQSAQIAAGQKPDNYLAPAGLSELERNHLRDAFLVVKTMQSALGSGI